VDDKSMQMENSGSEQRGGETTINRQPSAGAAKAWWRSMTTATMVARRQATMTAGCRMKSEERARTVERVRERDS
jgi:hypothetical protein